MQKLQKGKQIYQICPIHPKQYLQVVCLQCDVTSLACPLCIDLAHKNHTMISLKKFISSEMPKLYESKPNHKVMRNDIHYLAESYQKLFQKMRKLIGQQINQLQKRYHSEIQALQMQTDLVCGVGEHLYTLQNVSLLKKKISKQQKIPDTKTFTTRIHDMNNKMQVLVSEVTQDICDIIRGLSNFWDATKQLLLNSKRQFRFTFSNDLKHKSLSIQVHNWKGRKIVNQVYDNSYHIGVVEPPLNPFMNEVTFRVDKSNRKCVWLGICELKKIIDRRFSNCYKKGQGGYWIWQAGCKGGAHFFSSLLTDSQTLPWNFQVGDKIKIRLVYEQDNRFVQFQKNDSKIFRSKLQKSNMYCACVGMGAENESVVILQQ